MSCLEVRALLPLRPLEALEEDEESLVEGHLEGCVTCRVEAQAHDQALGELTEALSGPEHAPREGLTAELWAKVEDEISKPIATPEPAPAAGPELSISLACSYCHDTLSRADACYCASCLAPHHEECFRAHGRCSAIGCEETLTVRPTGFAPVLLEGGKPPARNRVRRWVGGGIVAVLASVSAAALTGRARTPVSAPVALASPTLASPTLATPAPVAVASPPSEPAPVPEIPEESVSNPPFVDVTAIDRDLGTVVAEISSASGRNVFVSPEVSERVTLTLRHTPWREAIDVIAEMQKCQVKHLGEEVLVLTQPRLVTYSCQEADVVVALREVARQSGRNVLVAPTCRGKAVTVVLNREKGFAALVAIVRAAGLRLERKGEILVVLPARDAAETKASTAAAARGEVEGVLTTHALEKAAEGEMRSDFTFKADDLRDVCDTIGRKARRNLIVEPDIHQQITVALHQATWSDAVRVAAWMTPNVALDWRNIIVLRRLPTAKLTAARAPASEWFRLLAASTNLNLVCAPDVKDEIEIDLERVTGRDVLDATALAYGYTLVEEKPGLIRVSVDRAARSAMSPRPLGDGPRGKAVTPSPSQGYLGLNLSTSAESDHHLRVTVLETGGAAENAGFRLGDEVLQWNGEILKNLDDFKARVARIHVGDRITLRILREGWESDRTVVADEIPNEGNK